MNLSRQLITHLQAALRAAGMPPVPLQLELPPNPELGDRSCTIALALAKELKRSPRQIAQEILAALPSEAAHICRGEIAGSGYLNFFWTPDVLRQLALEILRLGGDYGSSDLGSGQLRLFEFVSANPTGPLNIVSARAAATGDALVRLQKKIGFAAASEYYVNDAGRQVELLGASVQAQLQSLRGETLTLPEGGYHGAYVLDLAQMAWRDFSGDPLDAEPMILGRWTAHRLVEEHKSALTTYGVDFDRWFFESELHSQDRPAQALDALRAAGSVYEKEGATFFRSSLYGDDEDRVIITSDGRPTYFLPDIAYHLHKAERGYQKVFDLWGPDHHGHVQRMQAALKALGLPEDFLEVLIIQQVNLLRGGQPVKMSKRTGEMITMRELLDEVGSDAAKQIFLSRRWSSHLDFDIEVAKDRSEKSPVFYVQYAHARICSIFRKADNFQPPGLTALESLSAAQEWELLRALSRFPDVVEAAAQQLAPNRLNSYLSELATSFHKFYHECRVLSENPVLTQARLGLCRAVQFTLKEGLRLLGLSAPEQM